MTRIFNMAFLLLLGGIFYNQTDGFGTHLASASAVADTTPIAQPVAAKTEPTPEPATATLPIIADINALSEAEKDMIKARFTAQRLAASTPIRTVNLTKSIHKVATAPVTEPQLEQFVVSGKVVNARAKPTTTSDVLAKLRRGTQVLATGRSDGKWAQVIVSDTGQSVWMHSDFLSSQS